MKIDKTKPKTDSRFIPKELRDKIVNYWRTNKNNEVGMIARIFDVPISNVQTSIDLYLKSLVPHFEPENNYIPNIEEVIDEIEDVDETN